MLPLRSILMGWLAVVPIAATTHAESGSAAPAPPERKPAWASMVLREADALEPLERARVLTALAQWRLDRGDAAAAQALDNAAAAARAALAEEVSTAELYGLEITVIDPPGTRQAGQCFHHVLKLYVDSGRADRALELAAQVDADTPARSAALAAVASAQARVADLEAMHKTFDRAKRAACGGSQIQYRTGALLHVAEAQRRAGCDAQAAQTVLLAQQEVLALPADSDVADSRRRAWRAMLQRVAMAWARLGEVENASLAARHMGILPGQKIEDVRSTMPRFHLVTLAPRFTAELLDRGDREKASALLAQTEDAVTSITYDDDSMPGFHRSEMLCGLAQAYVNLGDGESALRCLGRAREMASGIRLNWHRRQIAQLCAAAGDDQAAMSVTSEMVSPASAGSKDAQQEQALAYAGVAEQQFRAGRAEPAAKSVQLALAAALKAAPEQVCDCLARLAFVLLEDGGGPAKARPVLDQAARALRDLPSQTREHLAARLAEGYARCDDVPAARDLVRRHVAPPRRREALREVLNVQVAEVARRLRTGKPAAPADAPPTRPPDEAALRDLARALLAEEPQLAPALAQAFLDAGRPEEAAHLLAPALAENDPSSHALELVRDIAVALARAGKTDGMEAWLKRLARPAARAWLCVGALEGGAD